ncbi:hypothetical protein [Anaerofustis sp.]|uniref:hypothetical protein n=1 Tax=Anaerofustis sp. TaxID=1872517 RepID=UPI0025BD8D2E|nr:hypothetical protein [Anaerofustis sp.]
MNKNKINDIFNNFIKSDDKNKYILILLLLTGLFLIFCSSLFSSDKNNESEKSVNMISSSEYKIELEKSIEDTLKEVKGVGNVKVTVTLDGDIEKNIAYNESNSTSTSSNDNAESNDNTNSSKDAVMVREGSSESPFTTKDKYPEVVGVVIVASGANNKTVEYYITKSVEALLDLPSYKVVVLPSKENI